MWQGAVFFDYDGTLVDKMQGVPVPTSATKQAVAKLRKNGYLAVLCTGRPLAYVPQDAKDLAFDAYITANGAYAEMKNQVLFDKQLDQALVQSFQAACERRRISYALEGQNVCYYKAFGSIYKKWLDQFRIHTDNIFPIEQANEFVVNKMMIAYEDEQQAHALVDEFRDQLVFDEHAQFSSYDVTCKGINKGTGMQWLLEKLDLSSKQAYAIGDSDNDLEMVRRAGTGIAMGQHSERLGQTADYITESVANDGAAKALAHFSLVD